MASEASAQAAQCCLHRLRFAEIEEFPDDEVDFSDILGGFAVGRCQALCRPCDGEAVQIPLCLEDVEETDDPSLFDVPITSRYGMTKRTEEWCSGTART